jgi:hypothetical protein
MKSPEDINIIDPNSLVNRGKKSSLPYLGQMVILRIKISLLKSNNFDIESIDALESSYLHYKDLFLKEIEGYDPFNAN